VFYEKPDGKIGMQIDQKNKTAPRISLNYSIEGKDTILLLTVTDDNSIITHRYRNQFRKFPETDGIRLTALEYFVDENLFAGEWNGSTGKVTFSPYGEVQDFHGYNRYSIATSEDNPDSRPDEISFYNDSIGVTYAFTFDSGKLQLYEIKESEDGFKFSRGKMVAELERK
jgi:hypothetical protein